MSGPWLATFVGISLKKNRILNILSAHLRKLSPNMSECFPTKKRFRQKLAWGKEFQGHYVGEKVSFTVYLGPRGQPQAFNVPWTAGHFGKGAEFLEVWSSPGFFVMWNPCGTPYWIHEFNFGSQVAPAWNRKKNGSFWVSFVLIRNFAIFSCNMLQPLYKWKTQWFLDILFLQEFDHGHA